MTLPARSIDRGIVMTAILAAVATGVAKAQEFSGPSSMPAAAPPLHYTVVPNTGALTTLTMQLQVSNDNGTTWINRGAAIDGVAAPSGDLPGIYEGEICRLNIVTLALGTAANFSVFLNT